MFTYLHFYTIPIPCLHSEVFAFSHYVGTHNSNATGCWTGCVWTWNSRYVWSASQAKSQHRQLTYTAFGTAKYKNNIYYPERERLYSNRLYYTSSSHYLLWISNFLFILPCHYTIMHQFHNGYQSGKWAIGELRHLNLCQHTIRHMAKIYCYGVGVTCALAVQDVFRCALESYQFPTHPPSPPPPLTSTFALQVLF